MSGTMSKTSDIKDRLLALSGYIRARHAAVLLGCSPKTVVRNKYDGMDYGSVWYVKWPTVLQTLGPDTVKVLKLPASALEALDTARGHARPVVRASNAASIVELANAALERAKLAVSKAIPATSSLSVSGVAAIAVDESSVGEPPILAMPVKREEVLTLGGAQLVNADDLVEAPVVVQICKSCNHAVGYHKTKFGACKFAKGTFAACMCACMT